MVISKIFKGVIKCFSIKMPYTESNIRCSCVAKKFMISKAFTMIDNNTIDYVNVCYKNMINNLFIKRINIKAQLNIFLIRHIYKKSMALKLSIYKGKFMN